LKVVVVPGSSRTVQQIRTVQVIRYVAPLREGGSMPGVVEADDLGTYVLKFRGAGQGEKVLIAELIVGEIARALDLPVPELVFAELDERIGRNEGDPEIQDLITSSAGLNLAMDYLPGAFAFDAQDVDRVDPQLASEIVWLDAFVTNIDRTPRNTNMLIWGGKTWLIDHGASLYSQYGGPDFPEKAQQRFPAIRDHVLLPVASEIETADQRLTAFLSDELIREIVELVPEKWLTDPAFEGGPDAHRDAFVRFLTTRLNGERAFVQEAIDARSALL
jgi:hypothetical protein